MTTQRHVPVYASCTECDALMPITDQYILDYFIGTEIHCPSCSELLDWWSVIQKEILENFLFNQAFIHIGAKSQIFNLNLLQGQRTSYKLSDHGIPENAKVLYVNYTPYSEGGNCLFPVELTGNIPTRKFPRNEVALWPVPFGEGLASSTKVSVLVTWIDHSSLDDAWSNLVNAFEHYVSDQYEACIVPANVAVESTLSLILTKHLKSFAGKDRVKDFLENGATYSHQLNVLLPLIAKSNNICELPDHIRGFLNQLRSVRNQMAHNGKPDKPLTKDKTSELLCSALFGLKYIQLVQSGLRL